MGKPKPLPKNFREALQAAKEQGFQEDRTSGSHLILKNGTGKIAVLPNHNGDIPRGTMRSFLKMIGLLMLVLPVLLLPQIVSFFNSIEAYNIWMSVFQPVIR